MSSNLWRVDFVNEVIFVLILNGERPASSLVDPLEQTSSIVRWHLLEVYKRRHLGVEISIPQNQLFVLEMEGCAVRELGPFARFWAHTYLIKPIFVER